MPKRRRGSQRLGRRSHHVGFERLVERALAGIPSPFHDALAEVAIVIDDLPTRDQLADNELDADDTLYGLYEGVPRTEYGGDWVAEARQIDVPAAGDHADSLAGVDREATEEDRRQRRRTRRLENLLHSLGGEADAGQDGGVVEQDDPVYV